MKNTVIVALTSVLLASTASAGGVTFSLPNLTFPPAPETIVTQDCQSFDVTESACIKQE